MMYFFVVKVNDVRSVVAFFSMLLKHVRDNMSYDFCIIGGGVSGLAFATRLASGDGLNLETGVGVTCCVLEADPSRFGGRAQRSEFRGVKVVEGAGVAREGKDVRLTSLLRDMGVPYEFKPRQVAYAPGLKVACPDDAAREIKSMLGRLQSHMRTNIYDAGENFGNYAKRVLGEKQYSRFKQLVGFTDYERASIKDTLEDYGFDDNYVDPDATPPPRIAPVKWDELVRKMIERIEKQNGFHVVRGARAYSVVFPEQKGEEEAFTVKYKIEGTGKGAAALRTLKCRNVVFATTVNELARLYPTLPWKSYLCTQSFLRAYARVDKRSSRAFEEAVRAYTVVPGPLQKVIPVDADRGVYMVAYSDNANADRLRAMGLGSGTLTRAKKNRVMKMLEGLLRECLSLPVSDDNIPSVKIIDLVSFYWKGGTHYFPPDRKHADGVKAREKFLSDTISPSPRIYVIGEGFSRNQGWTEGALERVDSALRVIASVYSARDT